MGQALYRKYRSKSFSEVVGQEPITDTLSKAIKSGRISHAYLLAGPRGVGKTSVARILAHEVNNLPYKEETIHLDIIEIDAASNRRIDEIRDIREKVHIAPTSAKYKVYIIDEVHMLTKEAFNALLKTLEEPPAHCIFILATTEAHKLPETIISRTQRFNFKPASKDMTVAHLKSIAKAEKINIEGAALELLAEHGGGSFRDAIGMLDQLSGSGQIITPQDVHEMLGLPQADTISQLIKFIDGGDTQKVLMLLNSLREDGSSPALISAQLGKHLRASLLSSANNYVWASSLLKNLLDVSASKQPHELLEISILEVAQQNAPISSKARLVPQEVIPEIISSAEHIEPIEQKLEAVADIPQEPTPKLTENFGLEMWPEVVNRVKQRAAALYTALRLAQPNLNDNVLILGFQFPLHMKKVKESRHIDIVSRVVEELSGQKLTIRCELVKMPSRPKAEAAQPAQGREGTGELAAISNIFGNAELLES